VQSVEPLLQHHYAGVWDGQTVRLYIDGYDTNTTKPAATTMRPGIDPVCIGSSSTRAKCGTLSWGGDIAEPAVWNRALTPDELRALSRRQPFAGSAQALAASWLLNEGTGQVANDQGSANRDGVLGSTTKAETADPAWRSGN
jgi:hypothetical protein